MDKNKGKTKPKAISQPPMEGGNEEGNRKTVSAFLEETFSDVDEEHNEEESLPLEHSTLLDINISGEFMDEANKQIQILVESDMPDAAAEIKRLMDACYSLYAELGRIKKTNEELLPKITEADDKLVLSFQITASSQETINRLKAALEDSWREIDASRVREQDFQDELRELYEKCRKHEQKGAMEDEEASDLGPLAKYKQIILRERDRLNGEVMELERRLQLQRFYGETLEQMCQNIEEQNRNLRISVEKMEAAENKAERRIHMLTKNVDELKEVNTHLLKRTDIYEKQVEDQQNVLKEKTKEIEKLHVSFEKLRNEHAAFSKQLLRIRKAYNTCTLDRSTLMEQIKDLRNDNKSKDQHILIQTRKYRKVWSDFENMTSKVYKLEKQNFALHEEVTKYKNQLNTREKDIIIQHKNVEDIRRLKEIVTHERDSLRSEITKLNNQIGELRHTNILRNIAIDNLHLDIAKHQGKLEETKKIITKVEKERDEQIQEVELLHDKIDYFQEQIQLKADHITELQREVSEKHANYIKVQKLLETTNSERIMLQRSLQSCGEERTNLKNLQSVTNHQMAQLTEEITINQNKINILNLQIDKMNREKQELATELRTTKNLLSSTRAELKEVKAKNDKLQKTLQEDELRFMKLVHTLEETRKEKNLIGLQMVRRNDEISLLRERLEIVQTALDRGQVQYNQRIEDIRLLKLEISKLQTQRDVLRRGLSNTANMRREIIRLQRSLDQERVECRALKEDLRVPVNVHRWRVLGGSDPDRYILVQKVKILQKRLLLRFLEGAQREHALHNCHKLYLSLQKFMEKLPSYKVKEDFVKSQRILRSREKKLKALTAELTAKDVEVKSKNCTIAELSTNLVNVKRELFEEKKLVSKLQKDKPIPLPPGRVCSV